jgi:flavin-dependent dehydrogenase
MRNEKMKVAILGAGISGSTLFRLLRDRADADATLFGKQWQTKCGIRPCAWGVNTREFTEICGKIGLEPKRYVLDRHTHFYMNGIRMPCDVSMIDKPALLHDLAGDNIMYSKCDMSEYNRIIDATGINADGKVRYCHQQLIEGDFPLVVHVRFFPFYCYWCFPMDGKAHVGVLSGVIEKSEIFRPECECFPTFRVGLSKELVKGKVWKVGEAAGIIDPITGSGILPAMLSAKMLAENWDDSEGYEREIQRTFGYMGNRLRALFHNEFRGIPIEPLNILKGVIS